MLEAIPFSTTIATMNKRLIIMNVSGWNSINMTDTPKTTICNSIPSSAAKFSRKI